MVRKKKRQFENKENVDHSQHGASHLTSDKSDSFKEVSFDVLDKNGDVHRVEKKPLYGVQDIEAMTYFYTMLYYLSCCDDFDQFQKLYSYVVDNDDFDGNYPSRDPIEVMAFIDNFANTLKNVSDLSFADGLKRLLSKRYKRAQELIASKPNPIN